MVHEDAISDRVGRKSSLAIEATSNNNLEQLSDAQDSQKSSES